MTNGPIRRIERERVEDRRDSVLPTAWIEDAAPPRAAERRSWLLQERAEAPPAPVALREGAVAPPAPERDGPVLVMLGADAGPALAELIAHAEAGARVYALVPPGWGTADKRLLACPKVLVRRVPEVPVSGVHRTGAAQLQSGPWTLRLDAAQTEAFRMVFLRLFWHEATEEAWTGGRQLAWRAAAERPFDVPEVPPSAPVRLVPPSEAGLDTERASLHLATLPLPDAAPRRLWVRAGGEHHERLARLVRDGAEVVWDELGLPDLAARDDGGTLLLPGSGDRLRIVLTAAQAGEAARLLAGPARWTFRVGARLGDHARDGVRLWLPGETAARAVERQQQIAVADVRAASIRVMEETAPATWPPPQPLALTVRYRWTVVPPLVPAGAAEDALHARWRAVDQEWASRLDRLWEALKSAEKHRGSLGRTFSRLVSALLGFERTQREALAEVARLRKERPSALGPAAAPPMFARLAELEAQAAKLQNDLEDAERKAREDEEREKQQRAWQARIEAAKTDLGARREALAAAEARLAGVRAELTTHDEAPEPEDKKARKDRAARRKKLSDEQTRAEKDVAALGQEIASLGKRIEEPFVFQPPASAAARKPGNRFVPAATTARAAPAVPHEALPEVGELRSRGQQRYLVIRDWETLAAGEAAAARFPADLVSEDA